MKLKFDAELDFQRDAIEAVTAAPPVTHHVTKTRARVGQVRVVGLCPRHFRANSDSKTGSAPARPNKKGTLGFP